MVLYECKLANKEAEKHMSPKPFLYSLLSLLVIFSLQAGQTHHPQAFLQSIQGSKEEGRQIVKHFCSSCHSNEPLIQLGAPRIGKKRDWLPRLDQGMSTLIAHTEEGFGAMPPRGGCFECSDQQLLLAILEMLPFSLRERALTELRAHKKFTKTK